MYYFDKKNYQYKFNGFLRIYEEMFLGLSTKICVIDDDIKKKLEETINTIYYTNIIIIEQIYLLILFNLLNQKN